MTKLKILEKEPNLKKVWEYEARDFTPWLAEEDSLDALGKAVDMSLTLEETESSVDEFRADIVCINDSNETVVIENQLEDTDHTHLGQIITYAAGKDAKVIIWVVRKAKDAHAKAIQWLNEHTDINFFLVEIELWKISDETYAPHFNIVERPIDWKPPTPERNLTPREQLSTAFWRHFNSVAPSIESFKEGKFKTKSAWSQSFYVLRIGRSDIRVELVIRTQKKEISAGIYVRKNKDLYREFVEQKDLVEQMLGTTNVVWREGEIDGTIRIATPCDINNEKEWNRAVQWLCDNALKMRQVIEKVI